MVGIATIRKLERLEETLLDGENIQMGKPPTWAMQLVAVVAGDFGRAELPSIYWRRQPTEYSTTGLTQIHPMLKRSVISIRQGRHPLDPLSVLLHELAHWLVGIKESHSEVFYAQAFQLFAAHGDPIYSFGRELRYKPTESLTGLKLSGLDTCDLVAQMLEVVVQRQRGGRGTGTYHQSPDVAEWPGNPGGSDNVS